MPSTTKLVVSAITGVGVVGGGVGAMYAKQYFSKEAPATIQPSGSGKISIRKQLENKGKKLLDKVATPTRWDYKLETYKRAKDSFSFKLEKEDVATLQKICESKLTSDSNEENKKLLQDLEKICTVPSNGERLKKEGKKLIEEDAIWEQKVQSYNSNSGGADAIDGIEKSKADKGAIQKWCNQKVEKEFENDGDYSIFLAWCTKEGK